MENYDIRLEALRNDPEFAKMSSRRQYNAQVDVLVEELGNIPEFVNSNPDVQDQVIQGYMQKDFNLTYEDPYMASSVAQLKAGYLAGDPSARQSMLGFSQYTDAMNRASVLLTLAQSGQSSWAAARMSGIDPKYMEMGLNAANVRGADDDKAREDIRRFLFEQGDEEGLEQTVDKNLRGFVTAINVGEELMTAAVGVGVGGLIKGATTGARAASWVARNSPAIMTEAFIEGARGTADYINQGMNLGEPNSVLGAIKAFGVHAGIDMAIGHAAEAGMDLLLSSGKGVRALQNDAFIKSYGDKIARGNIEVPDNIPSTLDENLVRHFASNDMAEATGKELDSGVRFTDLPELDQANYRAYQQGYGVTRNVDDTFLVQIKNQPGKARKFNNLTEVDEWIGTQGSKYYDDLIEQGNTGAAENFLSRNRQLEYGRSRAVSDAAWKVDNPPTDFVQAGKRQYVTPQEFEAFVGNNPQQTVVRFSTELDDKGLKKGTTVYKPNEAVSVNPDPAGNSAYYIPEGKLATPQDLAEAKVRAEARFKKGGLGNASVEQLTRDELVKHPKGFVAAIDEENGITLLFGDNVKISNRFVNPKTGNIGNIANSAKYIQPSKAKMTLNIGTNIDELVANPKKASIVASRLLSGDVDAKHLGRWSESYLKARGITDAKVTVRTNNSGVVKATTGKNGRINLSVPAKITDGTKQRLVYDQMLRSLETQGKVSPDFVKTWEYTNELKHFQKNYIGSFTNPDDAVDWIEGFTKHANVGPISTRHGRYQWSSIKTGKTYDSADLNGLVRDIAVNEMDTETFIRVLKDVGYEAEMLADRVVVSIPGGDPVGIGDDLVELAQALDFYPSKLPSQLAPNMNIIDEVPGINLTANSDAVIGAVPEVNAFLGNFEDYVKASSADVRLRKKNGDSLIKAGKADYQVHITRMNYTKNFDNYADAKKFYEGEWKTIESTQQMAMDKGMRMYYDNGKFKAFNQNTNVTADTVEELQEKLSGIANPTYGPDIVPQDVRKALDDMNIELELPPGFGRMSIDTIDQYPMSREWVKLGDESPGVINKYMPRVAAIRRMAQGLEDKIPGVGRAVENLQKNMRIAQSKTFKDSQELMTMFKDKGKLIPPDRRQGISLYVESRISNPDRAADVARQFKLTDRDVREVVPALEEYYKRKSHELGIPYDKVLGEYQPHLRKWANEHKAGVSTELLSKDFIANDPDLKTFMNKRGFQNYHQLERANELIEAARDTDALSLAMRYTHTGNNSLYAKQAWDDMFDLLSANKDAVEGTGFARLMASFKDSFTHPQNVMHKSSVAKSIKNSAGVLGMDDVKGREVLDMIISLPYASSMAFRPWLPFRNMFQIFTILPLRTGNLHTSAKAAKRFWSNRSGILQEMLDEGIIAKTGATSSKEYMEAMRGASLEAPGKISQAYRDFMDKGLAWYAMSDDFNRGVTYMANKELFERGMRKATTASGFDSASFLVHSRLEGLQPAIQKQVLDYIDAGNLRAAETTMARANIDATQFDYGATNKPMGASGTAGHLYYQFGTYSMNYLQSVGTALTHGSTTSKLKSFTAMSAGMAAVAGMMKGIGVDNSSFLGYNMAMFNGGPYFQLAINATQAVSPGVRGQLARNELLDQLPFKKTSEGLKLQYPALAPMRMQVKYVGKASEAFKEGDYWGAFLASMTIPEHKSRNE